MTDAQTISTSPLGEQLEASLALLPGYSRGDFLNFSAFKLETVKASLESVGYGIVPGLIPEKWIWEIRSHWLKEYDEAQPRKTVTWAPYLGQESNLGFSKDEFQCLYRSCDFLWDEPRHRPTKEVCARLNLLRNLILDLPLLSGLSYSTDRYGVFITTSYYPPDTGWMEMHDDGVSKTTPLVHHIVPLTFKSRDYSEGGMTVIDKQGQCVDVDALLNPGDVIFYDARLKHGVKKIIPKQSGKPLGRLQMFAIPTQFLNPELNLTVIQKIPSKLFLRSRWLKLKNEARLLTGLKPILR